MQSKAIQIRIGTRGSALALTQARIVRDGLASAHRLDPATIDIVAISTGGDRLVDRSLSEAGGKGLFTREIEQALLAGEIDLAVHSSKDLPTQTPDGLKLAAFLEREDIRDAFVSLTAKSLEELPQGAKLGTSSIRRAAQMLRIRPDLVIVPFRGNVDTRLRRLADGVADATLLAVAGLNRLGRESEITVRLDPVRFPPAPAQGAIAIEIRRDDLRMESLAVALDHTATSAAVRAERAMLAVLDGSCRTPVGVHSLIESGRLSLHGQLLSPDGRDVVDATASGDPAMPELIGDEVGRRLLEIAGPSIVSRFGA